MKEYHLREIDSTQDYAKKLCLEGVENFVVYSDIQQAGRGRNGHVWTSPLGGLWFSFDMCFLDENEIFTLTIGVAVRKVLEEIYGLKVELKWPNDLILNKRKVGGIICEKINDKVIVGIGINTNISGIQEKNAITFLDVCEVNVNNYELMKSIIERCKESIHMKTEEIITSFRENMAYCGENCFVSVLNEIVKIIDIAETGGLVVETKNGIKEIVAGEINVCI